MKRLFYPILTTILIVVALLGNAPAAQAAIGPATRELQNSFVSVAKELKPSVVHLRVERSENHPDIQGFNPFGDEDGPFGDFFRKFFKEHPNMPKGKKFRVPRSPFKSEGAGSGVILDANGTILTNNHVVKGATKITVKLADSREFKAKVIGQDPQTDLAVIRIEAPTGLTVAKFADSDKVEVGQFAMAIGNPMGLEQTVTVGVVSAVGRSGLGASPIEDFIQTDAGINPGNSGGPLVNLDGEVIGINTLIFTAPGAGIGFAIPSNLARRVAEQIITKGSVERPYVGITMSPITPELADHYNLSDKSGTVIMEVNKDTPAGKAGLMQMDLIRSIDGKPMTSSNDVQKYVLSKNVGDILNFKVLRGSEEKTVPVKLERMPKSFGLRDAEDMVENPEEQPRAEEEKPHEKLGFSFQKLTPDLRKALGIEDGKQGVIVTEVEEGSPAEEGGLLEKDVITQVNNRPVTDELSLRQALKAGNAAKKSSVFVVIRDGSPLFLVIPEETAKK